MKKTVKDILINKSFDVYLDFVYEEGLLFIVIKNDSTNPVFNVKVKFKNKLIGVNGLKEISSLNLFKNIEFLAPKKEIKTFFDTAESFFSTKQPTKIATEIIYLDTRKEEHNIVIKHDLEIYRDIGYIIKKDN